MGNPSEGVSDSKLKDAASFLADRACRGIQGHHPKTRGNLATELNPNLPQAIHKGVSRLLAHLERLLRNAFRNPLDRNLRGPSGKVHPRPQEARLLLAGVPEEQHRSLLAVDTVHLREVQSVGEVAARIPSHGGQLDEFDIED